MAQNHYFCTLINILRGGAEVARRAHNPKVASSNLAPATKNNQTRFPFEDGFFYFCKNVMAYAIATFVIQ